MLYHIALAGLITLGQPNITQEAFPEARIIIFVPYKGAVVKLPNKVPIKITDITQPVIETVAPGEVHLRVEYGSYATFDEKTSVGPREELVLLAQIIGCTHKKIQVTDWDNSQEVPTGRYETKYETLRVKGSQHKLHECPEPTRSFGRDFSSRCPHPRTIIRPVGTVPIYKTVYGVKEVLPHAKDVVVVEANYDGTPQRGSAMARSKVSASWRIQAMGLAASGFERVPFVSKTSKALRTEVSLTPASKVKFKPRPYTPTKTFKRAKAKWD